MGPGSGEGMGTGDGLKMGDGWRIIIVSFCRKERIKERINEAMPAKPANAAIMSRRTSPIFVHLANVSDANATGTCGANQSARKSYGRTQHVEATLSR